MLHFFSVILLPLFYDSSQTQDVSQTFQTCDLYGNSSQPYLNDISYALEQSLDQVLRTDWIPYLQDVFMEESLKRRIADCLSNPVTHIHILRNLLEDKLLEQQRIEVFDNEESREAALSSSDSKSSDSNLEQSVAVPSAPQTFTENEIYFRGVKSADFPDEMSPLSDEGDETSSQIIESFVSAFTAAATLSKPLLNLFSVPLPSDKTSNGFYHVFLESLNILKVPEAKFLAFTLLQAIHSFSKSKTPELFMKAVAQATILYLLSYTVETNENASKLAQEYASILENAATKGGEDPYFYITALNDAHKTFFFHRGLFTPEKFSDYVIIFANQLYSVTETFNENMYLTEDDVYRYTTDSQEVSEDNLVLPHEYSMDIETDTAENSEVVRLFASSFFKTVISSFTLRRMFNFELPFKESSDVFYKAIYSVSKEIVFRESVAEIESSIIPPTIALFAPSFYVSIVGNAMGEFLFIYGDLNIENISYLSLQYAEALRSAFQTKNKQAGPLVEALMDGTETFMISVGFSKTREYLSSLFTKQLYTLTKNSVLLETILEQNTNEMTVSELESSFQPQTTINNRTYNNYSRLSPETVSTTFLHNIYNNNNTFNIQSTNGSSEALKPPEEYDFRNSTSSYFFSSVYLFSSSFRKLVAYSSSLRRAFYLTFPAPTASKIFYYAFYREFKDLGVMNPSLVAETIAEAVESTFDSMSPFAFVHIIAKSVGQYLLSVGVLNTKNYSTLSTKLSNAIREATEGAPNRQEFYISSIIKGLMAFLSSLGIFTSDKASVFASYLANELIFYEKTPRLCSDELITSDIYLQNVHIEPNWVEKSSFSSSLLKDIMTSHILTEFFNVNISSNKAAIYENVYESAVEIGLSNPAYVARKVAQVINLANVSSYTSILATSLEKFLISRAFLTDDNADELAHAYSRALTQTAISSNEPPSFFIKALLKATHLFVIEQFVWNIDNPSSLSSVLLSEFISSNKQTNHPNKVELNAPVFILPWNIVSDIYNLVGSDKATLRIKNLAKAIAFEVSLTPAPGINIDNFIKNLLSITSDIHFDNHDLKEDELLIETLLEAVSALLQVTSSSHGYFVHRPSTTNIDLSEAYKKYYSMV